MLTSVVPPAVRPIYAARRPNVPISLYSGPLQVVTPRGQEYLKGRIAFEWLPSHCIRVVVDDVPVSLFLVHALSGDRTLSLSIPSSPICHPLSVNTIGSGGLRATVLDWPQLGPLQGLTSVVFHVPNFPEYDLHGQTIHRGRRIWGGRIACEASGWRIAIDSLSLARARGRRLAAIGGFGITHAGRLERIDGSAFGADDATDLLEKVSFFLSFARGAWSCCVLPVGFDDCGRRRWEEWGSPIITRSKNVLSWFSTAHPSSLTELFPGYMQRVSDQRWWHTVRRALVWYLQCNIAEGPLESALVIQQAALELLAWTTIVEVGGASAKRFDKLPASRRLRRLLAKMNIPASLPASLQHLATAAATYQWSDGPEAIVEMRNIIVHPSRRQPVAFEATTDAWRLGVWYLEMVLLWLFGYRGDYCSRLHKEPWHGQVDRVPWA